MTILGKPEGIFELDDSDKCVGSYLRKSDIKEILNIDDNDLGNVPFIKVNGLEVADERIIQKLWYKNKIPNAIPVDKSSLDELLLIAIINRTYPGITLERQIRVKRYLIDLMLTQDDGKQIFIEFDGPSHFAPSRWGIPKNDPFLKKKIVEDATGIEVVNWAYWIQRCSSNVRVLFDKRVTGYAVLWSTEVHFGMFTFDNSASIIETITNRFNAVDQDGFGYIYGEKTRGRNNPEHPIVKKILNKKIDVGMILPKGFKNREYWLPDKLKLL